ncbi:MAG TPA: hypothetical protein PJ997_01110 [Candidatus Paceibacterota bacterium]|nr:hypothetical protein [Candidatus Paceibacterota bacterium]HMP18922.1 hypothetical protein [Candidatus Paceibacterota bacterium]
MNSFNIRDFVGFCRRWAFFIILITCVPLTYFLFYSAEKNKKSQQEYYLADCCQSDYDLIDFEEDVLGHFPTHCDSDELSDTEIDLSDKMNRFDLSVYAHPVSLSAIGRQKIISILIDSYNQSGLENVGIAWFHEDYINLCIVDYRYNNTDDHENISEKTQPIIFIFDKKILYFGSVVISGTSEEIHLFLESLQENLLEVWETDFFDADELLQKNNNQQQDFQDTNPEFDKSEVSDTQSKGSPGFLGFVAALSSFGGIFLVLMRAAIV